MAADSEISLLTRGMLSKATHKTWPSQPAEEEEDGDEEAEQPSVKFLPPEGGIPSSQLRCFDSESLSIHDVAAETRPSDAMQARLSLSFDTSQASVRSTDTTLEYFDAPAPALSEDQEGEEVHTAPEKEEEVVTVNIKGLTETQEPEEEPSLTTEQTPLLTSEDTERGEEEEVKEDETFEDVIEIGLEEETKNEEEVKEEDEQEVESSIEYKDAATLPQEEMSSHNQGNSFTEFALFVSLRLFTPVRHSRNRRC